MARILDTATAETVAGEKKVAVAYSGGLDSSVVAKCAMGHTRVLACSAYADGSGDSRKVKEAASSLGVELVTNELNSRSLSTALAELDLPFLPSPMDKSLWCLYYWTARCAGDAGARVLLIGQLADELFGGYAKYVEAMNKGGEASARMMMDEDLREYELRGRVRDMAACGKAVQAKLPFDNESVKRFASNIPVSYKIRAGERKAVLRHAAVLLGLPSEISWAPKKAAQYSSGIQKLVARSRF